MGSSKFGAGGTCSQKLPCYGLASWPRKVQGNTTNCFILQKLGYALAPMTLIQCRLLILTVLFGETMALTNSEEAMDAERMVSVLPRRNFRVEPVSYVGGLWLWSLKRDMRKWIMPKYNLPQQFKIMNVLINALSWCSWRLLENRNLVMFSTFIIPVKCQLVCHLYPSIWTHLLLFDKIFTIPSINKTPQVNVTDHAKKRNKITKRD